MIKSENGPLSVGTKYSLRARAEAAYIDLIRNHPEILLSRLETTTNKVAGNDDARRNALLVNFRDEPDIPMGASREDFSPSQDGPDWAKN